MFPTLNHENWLSVARFHFRIAVCLSKESINEKAFWVNKKINRRLDRLIYMQNLWLSRSMLRAQKKISGTKIYTESYG